MLIFLIVFPFNSSNGVFLYSIYILHKKNIYNRLNKKAAQCCPVGTFNDLPATSRFFSNPTNSDRNHI